MAISIAVICALPNERNTGMATVDLAAYTTIQRLAPEARITLYVFGTLNEWTFPKAELPYRYANILDHQDEYLKSDIFIFWGDFFHARSYWLFDRGHWDETHVSSASADFEAAKRKQHEEYSRFLFMSDFQPEEMKRVMVFGSTILTNDAADELDLFYKRNYEHFFGNAGSVYFRDALSAARVSPLRPDEPTLACDCALLLEDKDLALLPGYQAKAARQGIGVFFGRSPSKFWMMLFARLVARNLELECEWFPWLFSRRRYRWLAKLFGFEVKKAYPKPGELLTQLSGYRFIITDTYHLCVNAWRMGIPAICIGEGAGQSLHSLGDKKKELFFETYGARQYYVFLEKLRVVPHLLAEADRVAVLLSDKGLAGQVCANVIQSRNTALKRLRGAIANAKANVHTLEAESVAIEERSVG